MTELLRRDQAKTTENSTAAPTLTPAAVDLAPTKIDKSQLPIAEPKRLRDKAHLKFVASQPCLVCGRQPSDPHHVHFAQPRAIGLKVSDEFTVPLPRSPSAASSSRQREDLVGAYGDRRAPKSQEVFGSKRVHRPPLRKVPDGGGTVGTCRNSANDPFRTLHSARRQKLSNELD